MDRDELLRALEGPGPAFAACREALLGGASYTVHPALVPARELREVYRQRLAHEADRERTSIGIAEAVDRLEQYDGPDLCLAHVEGGPSGLLFQLFLSADRTCVVACLGIERRT